MHEPGPGLPPPRFLIVHDEEPIRRALIESLALIGVPLANDTDKPDILVYRLTSSSLDSFRQVLDATPSATVVLLDGPDRLLMTEIKSLPVLGILIAPYTPDQVAAAVDLALARHREKMWLSSENDRLQQTLNNRKLIERAKGALMKRFRWTEPEAFRRLQRAAMNRRMPMADLARQILEGRDIQL